MSAGEGFVAGGAIFFEILSKKTRYSADAEKGEKRLMRMTKLMKVSFMSFVSVVS